MSANLEQDLAVMAQARRPSVVVDEKAAVYSEKGVSSMDGRSQNAPTPDGAEPTMEEMKTLRRISGKIPWTAYTVTFVEYVSPKGKRHPLSGTCAPQL